MYVIVYRPVLNFKVQKWEQVGYGSLSFLYIKLLWSDLHVRNASLSVLICM